MTERMSMDKGELSVERECDMSVLIKQICKESDVMSQCVPCLSSLRRTLECCTRLNGTLQSVAGMFPEKGMSGSDAQFVKLKGLIIRLIIRLEAEVSHISDCNEEMLMIDEKKEKPEVDDTSSSTMFTSPEVIDEAGFDTERVKDKVAGHIRRYVRSKRYQHP